MKDLNKAVEIGIEESKRFVKGGVVIFVLGSFLYGLYRASAVLGDYNPKQVAVISAIISISLLIIFFWALGCIDKCEKVKSDRLAGYFNNIKLFTVLLMAIVIFTNVFIMIHFEYDDNSNFTSHFSILVMTVILLIILITSLYSYLVGN
ncbi:TPA: hypothetical protein ACQ30S_004153 [Yersinia enterocolitica]